MKKISLFLLIVLIMPVIGMAQPGMPTNPTPIDGGLLLLVAAGAGIGIAKRKK